MIPADPLHIRFRQIGQGDIIALQKRKPRIIILEIQGFPHSLRHLIDKAENTFVMAGAVLVHQTVVEDKPQILIRILIDRYGKGLIIPYQFQRQMII